LRKDGSPLLKEDVRDNNGTITDTKDDISVANLLPACLFRQIEVSHISNCLFQNIFNYNYFRFI